MGIHFLNFLCFHITCANGDEGLRKPQLDGDLRRIRSGGEKGVLCNLLP